MGSGLWIYLVEAGLALAILVFVVWWTLPRDKRNVERRDQGDDPRSR